ncbi:MAG: hypothetical protein HY739_12450 [Desulfobacterales bacterium]|nr:hypothetical protein [Desulfobacterales bacterium]
MRERLGKELSEKGNAMVRQDGLLIEIMNRGKCACFLYVQAQSLWHHRKQKESAISVWLCEYLSSSSTAGE